MATYVPGVPQYLPTFKPFTPDFKFLSNVLDVREQKYNTNYKALNDLYGKVVYGDLSRKDTTAMRDQFAENLGPQLQQISGMDLSMMQNAEAAKSIFKPFFEEDLIVKDLVTTKVFREEMQGAELLRNNPNQEAREMYWQTGVQKMQYEMEDFVNATEADAMRMAAPKYTADADLHEMAMAVLKESGLETGDISEFSKDGMWKITRANGDLISREALQLVQKTLKDDPRVIDAYHAKAFVESRQFADNGIKEGAYQTVDEGQVAWAADKISNIESKIAEQTKGLEKEQVVVQNTATSWEVYRSQHGLVKGSNEAKLARESWSIVSALKLKINSNKEALSGSKSIDASNPEELIPQNKQKLLYRAYGLMMNLNMESDLQSAALIYSNIGKKIDYEATELQKNKYQVSQINLRHRNSLALNAQRGIENRKTAKYKIDEEAKAAGVVADALDFLNGGPTMDDLNTTTAELDDDGNLAKDYDVMDLQNEKFLERDGQILDNKVNTLLSALQGVKRAGAEDAFYEIAGVGKGTLPELQKFMAENQDKPEIRNAIEAEYTRLESLYKAPDAETAALADGQGSDIVSNPEELAKIQDQFRQIKTAELGLDAADSAVKRTLSKNLDLALETDLSKAGDYDDWGAVFKEALNSGMPTIFYEDKNGNTHQYTEAQYLPIYSKWAQSSANNSSVKDTPFDDSQYFKSDKKERTQNENDEYSKLGYGQTPTKISSGGIRKGGGREADRFSYSGDFSFQQDLADDQAASLYNAMYKLTNYTATGALEGAVGSEAKMFNTPDLDQFMKGVDVANMSPGDVAKNPTYTTIVDPFQLTPFAVDMLKNVHDITQINSFETVTYMDDVPFSESQRGDTYNNSNASMLNPDDEIDAGNFTAADALLKDYFMQLRRMQGPTPTKSKYPTATIKYYPAWTSDPDDLSGGKAGYTITFGEDYLEQYRKAGGILDGLTGEMGGKTAVLNIVIPSSKDKNTRKQGEMNFSSIASQVSSSSNGGYQEVVPLGGSMNITQDHNGQYEIAYEVVQFDATTAGIGTGWAKTIQRQLMTDHTGAPITSYDRRYLDYYTNQYTLALEEAAKVNNADREAWKAGHPDMMISDPEYLYKF
tara:strand:- start:13821 stop:17144 length:3324 start_codon:yes stop_codon:yes gene_type:complete